MKINECEINMTVKAKKDISRRIKKGDEVELLGKYISLARAYNVIVNTYEGEYEC